MANDQEWKTRSLANPIAGENTQNELSNNQELKTRSLEILTSKKAKQDR
ncbi:hypothetical protein [Mammaliicoccus sciuri]|nr:hypothetical protein [Mammaliicoccus sciuri]MCJ0950960.1 hypothetical protein [Mammaliicoccus sciuri]